MSPPRTARVISLVFAATVASALACAGGDQGGGDHPDLDAAILPDVAVFRDVVGALEEALAPPQDAGLPNFRVANFVLGDASVSFCVKSHATDHYGAAPDFTAPFRGAS